MWKFLSERKIIAAAGKFGSIFSEVMRAFCFNSWTCDTGNILGLCVVSCEGTKAASQDVRNCKHFRSFGEHRAGFKGNHWNTSHYSTVADVSCSRILSICTSVLDTQ